MDNSKIINDNDGDDTFENDSLDEFPFLPVTSTPMFANDSINKQQQNGDKMKNSLFINSKPIKIATNIFVYDEIGKIIDIRNELHKKKFKSTNNDSYTTISEKMKKTKMIIKNLMKNLGDKQQNLNKNKFCKIKGETKIPSSSSFLLSENSIIIKNDSSISTDSLGNDEQINNKSILNDEINETIIDNNNYIDDDDDDNEISIMVNQNNSINDDDDDKKILMNQTIINFNEINDSMNNKDEDVSMINETIIMNNSDDSLEEDNKLLKNNQNNIKDNNDEVKLKIFKCNKKRIENVNNNNKNKNNDNDNKRDYQCQRMFNLLCKNCQNYYSTRILSMNKLQILINNCSKHRDLFESKTNRKNRSPKNFWRIGFKDEE